MNKQDALRTIRLLSAIESVMLITQQSTPDYLYDEMYIVMQILEKIILEEK